MSASFLWSPLLPGTWLALLGFIAAGLVLLARFRRAPDLYARAVLLAVIIAGLMNPVVVHEVRQGLPDKLLIVVDDSPSENIAHRNETAAKALDHLQGELEKLPNIEPVVIHAGQDAASVRNQNTSLFAALREKLAEVPLSQVAGTVLITDGQVHDVPEDFRPLEKLMPFHVVLTGKKGEFDRKVTVIEAPKYGLLSQEAAIHVKVEDMGRAPGAPATMTLKQDGKEISRLDVKTGSETTYNLKLTHPGQNVFEFSVPAEEGEMTPANNTAAVIVNGVRDRLKVLLVSGSPHIGERAWRDLLKSDPSIDLVHFTILRSPNSFDSTPPREMALIAFPVEELFDAKIKNFDLIIFDRYAQYGLMQPRYFANIASYVKGGGAFLMAMGTDRPEPTLFQTAVGDILPVTPKPPQESLLSGSYAPALTETGRTHPVTGDLDGADKWGRWFTQADIVQARGETLMTGLQGKPLLILDKVGDGRVGVLTSDNIWMWSKGIDGGGPYTELLRHAAHWLMKEPELEEDYLRAEARGGSVTVSARNLPSAQKSVTLTRPDGQDETLTLAAPDKAGEKGWLSAKVAAGENGIYRFTNGKKTAYAVVGTAASAEFSDVHTTDERLKPLVEASGGGMIWYEEQPRFSVKSLSAHQKHFGGDDWLGVKENDAYHVQKIESAPLLPNWLLLIVISGCLIGFWTVEGGGRKKKPPSV